jgi:hypothetical protein
MLGFADKPKLRTWRENVFVRRRRGSKPVWSACHRPAAGYDHLDLCGCEFVLFWGFKVLLLYRVAAGRPQSPAGCGLKNCPVRDWQAPADQR